LQGPLEGQKAGTGSQTSAAEAQRLDQEFEIHASCRALFEHSLDSILLPTPDGRILAANPAACRLLGRTQEELCRLGRAGVVDPADHRTAAAVAERARTGMFRGELTFYRSDGTRFADKISSVVFKDEHRQDKASIFVRDITEHKEAHEALRKRDAILEAIDQGTDNIICVKDREGKILMANPAMCRLLGKSESGILGKDDLVFITDAVHVERIRHNDRRIMRTRCVEMVEETFDLQGRRRTYLFTKSPYLDAGGHVIGLIGIGVDITERKQAEAGLRRLAAIVESSNDAIISKDFDGTILTWNPAAGHIFGYGAEEIVGQNIALLMPEDRRPEEAAILDMVRNGQHLEHYEALRRKKDGTLFPVSITISPVKDATGTNVGASKIVRDITERKRAEAALRKSEQEFRSLAEAMPQIVWAARSDGWNIYFNQHWVAYTGLTLEESYGHGWNTPFHPDDRQRAWDAWQQATATGGAYELEVRLRRADGAYLWWLIRGVPLRDTKGKILKWFGTCTDIEHIKRAEAALRASEEQFRAMFEMAPVAIAQSDPNTGQWLRVNPKMCEITGYSADELLQMRIVDLTHAEERERDWKAFQRVVRGEAYEYRIEKRYLRKDGSLVWANVNMTVLRDAAGLPARTMATIEDITQRRLAEDALRESHQFNQEIIASAQEGIIVYDPDLRYRVWNPYMERLTGLSAAKVLDKPAVEVFPFLVESRIAAARANALAGGEPTTIEFEYRVAETDRSGWAVDRSSPLRDAQGKVIGRFMWWTRRPFS
jgi:PAS domain S-box-containing protein